MRSCARSGAATGRERVAIHTAQSTSGGTVIQSAMLVSEADPDHASVSVFTLKVSNEFAMLAFIVPCPSGALSARSAATSGGRATVATRMSQYASHASNRCRGRQRLSALTSPWCTYTDPEIAHVGLYVRQARERNIPVKTFTIPMHDVDRAIADNEEVGFVKINVRDRTDHILGATIVARHAGELISEITLAIVAGVGLRTLAQVIHAYPTQAEAIRKAADAYVRTRSVPQGQRRAPAWLRSLLR